MTLHRTLSCFANSIAKDPPVLLSSVLCRCAAGIDPYDASASAPHEIISFSSSFHGRTMGALALTYKQQYKTPFSPMIGGAKMVPWLDFDAVAEAVQKVGA